MLSPIEHLARKDRLIVGGALGTLAVLAWLYTLQMTVHMNMTNAGFMFLMWSVMMVAMMTPSAAPMVFAFARIDRERGERPHLVTRTGAFLLGYIALWIIFSAAATIVEHFLVAPAMALASPRLAGVLVAAAGLYQFTPVKLGCLSKCRAPLGFLLTEWRDGLCGAFVMGLRHGFYCLGCCWLLMSLLFVGGVMNLAWIAVLAIIVLAEKALPLGRHASGALGSIALVWAAWLFLRR